MSHPSEQLRHAMKPSPWVLFFRTFFLYQLLRFALVNLRMLRMISLSHGRRVPTTPAPSLAPRPRTDAT